MTSAVTRMPAARHSSISVARSTSVGCGGAWLGGVAVAQQADHVAQVLEGRARVLADDAGRLVAAVLERARVQGQQGQAVGEDVVHLAGDAAALGGAGVGDGAARAARSTARGGSGRASPHAEDDAGEQRRR